MALARSRPVTLLDVAAAAGVSHQTVSRVINQHPNVSGKTRARVLSSIDKLGYTPNRMARALVTSSARTVGIVGFGVNYFGPARMLVSIEEAVRASGYDLTFVTLEKPNLASLQAAVDRLASSAVDGVVVIAPIIGLDAEQIAHLHKRVPVVMTAVPPGAKVTSVILDQAEGSRLATRHLLDLGHTRIAEVSGPLNWNDAKLRREGWLDALAAAGLPAGPHAEGDWTAQSGYAAAVRLLAAGEPFTGLVASNDQMALGALRALDEHGLSVPGDVSVVGFDNIPESGFFSPPLTTVDQDFSAMGQGSVEHLLALIQNPNTPVSQRVLYPRLVLRSSTRKL